MTVLSEARERATRLLAETKHFDALGLAELAADSRALASVTLQLADELEAERSARRAIQQARDQAVGILERRAGDGLKAAAA